MFFHISFGITKRVIGFVDSHITSRIYSHPSSPTIMFLSTLYSFSNMFEGMLSSFMGFTYYLSGFHRMLKTSMSNTATFKRTVIFPFYMRRPFFNKYLSTCLTFNICYGTDTVFTVFQSTHYNHLYSILSLDKYIPPKYSKRLIGVRVAELKLEEIIPQHKMYSSNYDSLAPIYRRSV